MRLHGSLTPDLDRRWDLSGRRSGAVNTNAFFWCFFEPRAVFSCREHPVLVLVMKILQCFKL